MQDVNILHGVKTIMTNQTDSHAIVKGGRPGIVPPGGGGVIHCVGALSPAQALRSWPSSKLPLFFFLCLLYYACIYMSIYFIYILD